MVTLSVSPDRVSEDAGSTRVTVTGSLNSAARDSDTPVTISVEDGTAIAGTDFASVSDFTLTIPANEMRGTATFNLVVRHVIIFGYGHGLQRAIIDESQHRTPEHLIMAQH